MDARLQLFDYKTTYQFLTQPGIDKYNMPLYNIQSETPGNPSSQDIGMYPVYQGFLGPAYVNGIPVQFQTEQKYFYNSFPNIVQGSNIIGVGDGTTTTFTLTMPTVPGNSTPLNPPINAILRGHVDITGIMALSPTFGNIDPPVMTNSQFISNLSSIPTTSIDPAVYITYSNADGTNVQVCDSGVFLSGQQNLGFLISPGNAPYGNITLPGGYSQTSTITGITQSNPAVITTTSTFGIGQIVQISGVGGMTELNGNSYEVIANTGTSLTINVDSSEFTAFTSGGTVFGQTNFINYLTGVATVTFPSAPPLGTNIYGQCLFFETGLPRSMVYFNQTITLRSPPDRAYQVQLDAYLSPAAFFNTNAAIPFGYMAEYIARGAARKILSDTGDIDQFMFYEPLFKEQERQVWIRSQRQWTSTRTQTIYSQGTTPGTTYSSVQGGTAY